jgi:hypothetical protein
VLTSQLTQALAVVAPVVVRYLPAPQSMHVAATDAPVAVEYLPAPQSVHVLPAEAPLAVEYLPLAHSTQSVDASLPVAPEYLPAPQSVHATDPATALYFPATHATHAPPFGPVNPRLQTQASTAVCSVNACPEFAAQSAHSALPAAALYFEAAHAKHGPPSGPEYPAMQTQILDALGDCEFAGQAAHAPAADAPVAAEYVPAPQSRHVAVVVAPVTSEYLPAPQSRHAAEPVLILYLPAPHAVHAPPLGPVNPRLQTQLATAVDPTGACVFEGHPRQVAIAVAPVAVEYVLAPQSVHAAEPVDVLYFPATHKTHDSAFGPVEPAGQSETQSVNASLPAGDHVLAPQSIQVEATKAPVAVEYLPASQSVHATLPMISLYLPAAHAVHVPPISPVYPVLH